MSRARRWFRAVLLWWRALPAAVRFAAPVVVMVVLWLASAMPPPPGPSRLGPFWHNGAHVVAYFGLGTAWALAFGGGRCAVGQGLPRWVMVGSVLLALAYGIVDEWHQSYVPGRDCSAWDACSDLCGSLLAVAFVQWVLTGARRFARWIPGLLAASIVSVAAATWLPY